VEKIDQSKLEAKEQIKQNNSQDFSKPMLRSTQEIVDDHLSILMENSWESTQLLLDDLKDLVFLYQ
jgi:hypothetical protein